MTKNIVFKRPPLTEAVFDIRVELPEGIDINIIDSFDEKIKVNYPTRQINNQGQISFQVKPGEKPIINSTAGQNGYIYKSVDGSKIVQARKDGFTFNKLKPYTNWNDFVLEAFTLWQYYVKSFHPTKVTRVALRYINLIDLPAGVGSFGEYFTTVPEISEKLPQSLKEFFLRLVVPFDQSKSTAIITQTIDQSKLDESKIPYLFDIDVFKQVDISADDKDILKYFEDLRKIKNEIFINSLTEKAFNLFK